MDNVFLQLLNISMTASWIVLAVVLLRFALKKAPKWIVCLLWAIVGLRLIMPFSLESTFSLLPDREVVDTGTHQVQTGVEIIDNAVNQYWGSFSNPVPEDSNANAMDANRTDALRAPAQTANSVTVVSGIWAAGMALMAVYSVISYLLLRRTVREAIPYRDNIYFCDHVDSAFILGVFRPRIYLSSALSEAQMGYVIGHEKAHLVRRDHLWKPLGFVLLTVYWFNPVIWLAYILLCRDIELACDEKAIQNMNTEAKKGYSEALMACSVPRRMIAACPVAFGEVGVKERIKSVANYRKPAFWVVVIAFIACIVTAVCFLTDPVKDPKEYSYSHAEKEFQSLQAELSSENAMTKEACYLTYAEIFRMISEGKGKEMDQYAQLVREMTNNSVEFENEAVFTLAESYAEAYTALGTGNAGIQDLEIRKNAYLDIQMDYLGPLHYSVKMIEIGENWYSNPNTDQPYNGELGDYLVEITCYDCGTNSSFNKKYPAGTNVIGEVAPGSYEVLFKHVATYEHGYRFYIGCDVPFNVEEQAITEATQLMGSVSVRMAAKGISGKYKNVLSVIYHNFKSYTIDYWDQSTDTRLTTEEAHARYGVDKADIKRAVEAYTYAKYPNFDQLSEQEQVHLRKNFSDENIEGCRLFSKDGKLMIVAKTYTLEAVNIVQELIELPA